MDDRTTIGRPLPAPSGLAYLFWTSGPGRGRWLRLNPEGVTLGTSPRCEASFEDDTAVPEHGRIRKEEGAWFLYDLEGRGTTLLDEQPVYRAELRDRSRIRLGATSAVFRVMEQD